MLVISSISNAKHITMGQVHGLEEFPPMENFASSLSSESSQECVPFHILQWNILARKYTGYNAKFHQNGDAGTVESIEQTQRRYSLASQKMIELKPDAILLQEMEPAFLSTNENPLAEELLQEFHPYTCFGGASQNEPGTAVFLRKKGRLQFWHNSEVQRVGGSEETGGASKSCIFVPVYHSPSGEQFWLGSIHMTPIQYREEEALHHLSLCSCHCPTDAPLVLAGDFNASPKEIKDIQSRRRSLLTNLDRIHFDGATGLDSTFESLEHIDHLFISKELVVVAPSEMEKTPSSPWDPTDGSVTGASDHVYISSYLSFNYHE